MTDPLTPEVDVVAMPSLRADGTPDQTPGYKVLDDDGVASDAPAAPAGDRAPGETPAETPAETPPAEKPPGKP